MEEKEKSLMKRLIMECLPMTPELHRNRDSLRIDVIADAALLGSSFDKSGFDSILLELKQEQCLVTFDDKIVPTQFGINLYYRR